MAMRFQVLSDLQIHFQVPCDLQILYIYIVESHTSALGQNGSTPYPYPDPDPIPKSLKFQVVRLACVGVSYPIAIGIYLLGR